MSFTHRMATVAATFGLLMVGGGSWYLDQLRPADAAEPNPSAVPVVAKVVSARDIPIYLRGIGTVSAYNTDVVRSQIQGQITQIVFTEGQAVKAGDLLAQIDPSPYKAQIEPIGIATRLTSTTRKPILRATRSSAPRVLQRRS